MAKPADIPIEKLDPRALERLLSQRLKQAADEHCALERAAQIIDAISTVWHALPASVRSQINVLHDAHMRWIDGARNKGRFPPAPGIKRPVAKPKAKLCPKWKQCGCIAQGYINSRERNGCGRKPKGTR